MNSNSELKLYALVITYKNFDSLTKCLGRLYSQTNYLDKIVVVNNASNDETEPFLETQKEKIEILNLKINTGGAGGYHYGLKYCIERGADWVWCVEDDILSSINFADDFKKVLLNRTHEFEKVGFFYPKVLSINNRRKLDGSVFLKKPEQLLMGLDLLEKSQFAGCVLNTAIIKKVGLPYREFFIYYDDWEFTIRMIERGYYGLWLKKLFVWHNDDAISQSQPYLNRRKKDIWKHFYGIRNELYILRKKNIIAFVKRFLVNLIYIPYLILLKRKEDKLYVAFNWSWWTLKSLFFKTEIKFPDGV